MPGAECNYFLGKLGCSAGVVCASSYQYMSDKVHHKFKSPAQLHTWLQANHASAKELWMRIYKKGTGLPSVMWDDCVPVALTSCWTDGVRNALDDTAFLQRLTSRRAADRARADTSRRLGAGGGGARRWPLGHCLRWQRHHGDAGGLSGSAAARSRCPGFLRHPYAAEPVHHLPPAAQCQAGGNP